MIMILVVLFVRNVKRCVRVLFGFDYCFKVCVILLMRLFVFLMLIDRCSRVFGMFVCGLMVW